MNRPGQLAPSIVRLQRAARALQEQWAETRNQWDDQAARDFEARHLEPILPMLRRVAAATAEIEALFHRAADECSEPPGQDS
jgi:hypothetical protein